MKNKKIFFVLMVILGIVLSFIVISNPPKKQEILDSETSKPVSLSDVNYIEEINFVNDEVFEIIKKAYSKVDFKGTFEKGDEEAYNFYKEKYHKLIKCEVPFFDKQTQKDYYINEFNEMNYVNPEPHLTYGGDSDIYIASNYIYYFFDMDCDGMPELCITDGDRFVYIMKYIPNTDNFILWYEIPPSWTCLLGSRKLWFGGGVHPARYGNCSLDQDGKEECVTWIYIEEYYNSKEECTDILYMVALPEYADEKKNIKFSRNMKNQAIIDDDHCWFRVTEKQFDELTKVFFEARELAKENIKEVTFTYDELFADV